ncbi:hypothetical protein IWW39_001744 [Coemansia spiralis]|uniref:NADH-ubiquinone oxidoreductase subunit B14.7 n=1 Tax=Coemansia spiralis TaxID=417178 RepID=A0A9W8GPQ4_9FUNG|nr:hypothetical protein IWW39_001744 [Coemansia spiralis]
MVDGNNTFEERDWKLETAKYTLGGAGIGMLASAFQTAYAPTKTVAAMGGVFAGVDAAAAQIRGKDDYKNSAIAGCAAGLIAGARQRSIPAALGSCAFFAASMATYEYSGGFEGAMHGMTREQRDEYRAGIFASAADLRK